jgi:hypothetical protein
MIKDLAQVPVYPITCPTCQKESLYTIIQIIVHRHLTCPLCRGDRINVADHYQDTEFKKLLEESGFSRDSIGVQDQL